MAERIGKPLMPWQEEVALVGGELVEHPTLGIMVPAYRDVVMTVPRQSGKTILLLAWELQRALGWGSPQTIMYSAQDGTAARKKFLNDQAPMLEPRKTKLGIRAIRRANGSEGAVFHNGSQLGLMAGAEDSGHGATIHLAVKDEFFADFDDRRDQALGPAMITVPTAQKLTASTAGTDKSVPFNQLVARGRQAVLDGERHGIAYFEWSADPADDPSDEAVWWRCMPALGISQQPEDVRHELEVTFANKPDEFRRAYLNIPTKSDERLIPAATWDLVCSPDAAPDGQVCFGIDVNPERTAAAVVAAGGGVLEVVEHRPLTGWLLDRLVNLNGRHGRPTFLVDGSGPAGSFVDGMKHAGLRVQVLTPKDFVGACGSFFDAVVDRKLKVRRHPQLDAAVSAASKRTSGDAWAWARRSSTADISPLVAATLAWWGANGGQVSAYEERGLVTL